MTKTILTTILTLIFCNVMSQNLQPLVFTTDNGAVYDINARNDTMVVSGTFLHVGKYATGIAEVSTFSDTSHNNFPKTEGEVALWSTIDGNGGYYYISALDGNVRHITSSNSLDTSFHVYVGGNNSIGMAQAEKFRINYLNGILYVTGDLMFSMGINTNLIAIDAITKQILNTMPYVNMPIINSKIHNNKLYLIGGFDTVGTVHQEKIACIDLGSNSLTGWYPQVNNCIYASSGNFNDIDFYNNQVYISGGYSDSCNISLSHKIEVYDINSGVYIKSLLPETGASGFGNIYWAAGVDCITIGGNMLYVKTTGTFDTRITAIDLSNADSAIWVRYFNMTDNVRKMEVIGNYLYVVGGLFGTFYTDYINLNVGAYQSDLYHVIRLNSQTGQLDTWSPHPSTRDGLQGGGVFCMTSNGNNIFLGGNFMLMNSFIRPCMYLQNNSNETILPFKLDADLFDYVSETYLEGNTIYCVGNWQNVNTTIRKSVRRFDINTSVEQNWQPNYLGDAKCLAVTNNLVFVGGNFEDTTGGIFKRNLVAIDKTTGQIMNSWTPNPNNEILTLHFANGKLFVGGRFDSISNQNKNFIAVYDSVTLNLLSFSTPILNGDVHKIKSKKNKLWISGEFDNVNSAQADKYVSIDLSTGLVINTTQANNASGWAYDIYLGDNGIATANTDPSNLPIDTCSSPFIYKYFGANFQKVSDWCINVDYPIWGPQVYAVEVIGNDLYFGGRYTEINSTNIGNNITRIQLPNNYFAIPNRLDDIQKSELFCYPNPVSEILKIQSSKVLLSKLQIHNTLGQLLFEDFNLKGNTSISLTNLKSGIYYLTIIDDNKNKHTKKIIKE